MLISSCKPSANLRQCPPPQHNLKYPSIMNLHIDHPTSFSFPEIHSRKYTIIITISDKFRIILIADRIEGTPDPLGSRLRLWRSTPITPNPETPISKAGVTHHTSRGQRSHIAEYPTFLNTTIRINRTKSKRLQFSPATLHRTRAKGY